MNNYLNGWTQRDGELINRAWAWDSERGAEGQRTDREDKSAGDHIRRMIYRGQTVGDVMLAGQICWGSH